MPRKWTPSILINNSSLLLCADVSPPMYSWHTNNPDMLHVVKQQSMEMEENALLSPVGGKCSLKNSKYLY